MSEQNHRASEWHWEQALVDDYFNHRWHQVLEPLCETFQRWKAGELGHDAVSHAIEEAYKEKCILHNFAAQRIDRAVGLIQWWDRGWFEGWVEKHRSSQSVQPAPALA